MLPGLVCPPPPAPVDSQLAGGVGISWITPTELGSTSRPLSSAPVFSFSWAQVSGHPEASEPSMLTFPFHVAASGALRPPAGLPGPLATITYEESIEGGRPLRHTRSPQSETSWLAGRSRTPSLTLTKAATHSPVSPGALRCRRRVGTKDMACDDNTYKNAPSQAAFSALAGA